MLNCPKVETSPAVPESGSAQTCRVIEAQTSTWMKPALVAYGDVRQLTMGVSTGVAESGPPFLNFG